MGAMTCDGVSDVDSEISSEDHRVGFCVGCFGYSLLQIQIAAHFGDVEASCDVAEIEVGWWMPNRDKASHFLSVA